MSFTPAPVNREPFQQLPDGRYTVDEQWHAFFREIVDLLDLGVTGEVSLAKHTAGGTQGVLVIRNGIIISATEPT